MYVCIMPFTIFECRCWSSDSYNPVPGVIANPNLPSNNEYKGGFGSGSASKPFIHIPYIRTYIHTYMRTYDDSKMNFFLSSALMLKDISLAMSAASG